MRTLSEEFKAAIAEHGKVRVLIQMRRIPRMGLAACGGTSSSRRTRKASSATPS